MSLGFRCLLIVLICFFALWVYHKREGELSIWMGLSQPPPAEPPPGPAPFSGIVGNDTIIQTTIKPAPFVNGARLPLPGKQNSPWDRPSIVAAEPGGEKPRRRSANPSAPAQQPAAPDGVAGPLRLVNPPGTGTAPAKEPGRAAVQPPAPQPLPPPAVSYRTHTVKDGDKLWNLAIKYLGAGHRSKEISELNEEVRENPDRLRIGMVLKIPPKK